MIGLAKRILQQLLGLETYLKVMHTSFITAYDAGLLRKNPEYKYHYFVSHLIRPGDCVVDIGANLGYFSKIFSRLAESNGKVICIEPVKPFFHTLQWALRNRNNCILFNHALGVESRNIKMVLPRTKGFFRTGLAHIPFTEPLSKDHFVFETEMVRGSMLLKDLPKIDYIKCDVEGYEEYVLPELREVIKEHKPLIQIETGGSHKFVIFALLKELGYTQYGLFQQKLIKDFQDETEQGDYLFIHHVAEVKLLADLHKLNLIA
ncbi:MAG: FkbM family methyltransferase [Saprospiraceae bacterium]